MFRLISTCTALCCIYLATLFLLVFPLLKGIKNQYFLNNINQYLEQYHVHIEKINYQLLPITIRLYNITLNNEHLLDLDIKFNISNISLFLNNVILPTHYHKLKNSTNTEKIFNIPLHLLSRLNIKLKFHPEHQYSPLKHTTINGFEYNANTQTIMLLLMVQDQLIKPVANMYLIDKNIIFNIKKQNIKANINTVKNNKIILDSELEGELIYDLKRFQYNLNINKIVLEDYRIKSTKNNIQDLNINGYYCNKSGQTAIQSYLNGYLINTKININPDEIEITSHTNQQIPITIIKNYLPHSDKIKILSSVEGLADNLFFRIKFQNLIKEMEFTADLIDVSCYAGKYKLYTNQAQLIINRDKIFVTADDITVNNIIKVQNVHTITSSNKTQISFNIDEQLNNIIKLYNSQYKTIISGNVHGSIEALLDHRNIKALSNTLNININNDHFVLNNISLNSDFIKHVISIDNVKYDNITLKKIQMKIQDYIDFESMIDGQDIHNIIEKKFNLIFDIDGNALIKGKISPQLKYDIDIDLKQLSINNKVFDTTKLQNITVSGYKNRYSYNINNFNIQGHYHNNIHEININNWENSLFKVFYNYKKLKIYGENLNLQPFTSLIESYHPKSTTKKPIHVNIQLKNISYTANASLHDVYLDFTAEDIIKELNAWGYLNHNRGYFRIFFDDPILAIVSNHTARFIKDFYGIDTMRYGITEIKGQVNNSTFNGNLNITKFTLWRSKILSTLLNIYAMTSFQFLNILKGLKNTGVDFTVLDCNVIYKNDIINMHPCKSYGPTLLIDFDGIYNVHTLDGVFEGIVVPIDFLTFIKIVVNKFVPRLGSKLYNIQDTRKNFSITLKSGHKPIIKTTPLIFLPGMNKLFNSKRSVFVE